MKVTMVSDKIKSLVDFLTAGFEKNNNEDIFGDLENEASNMDYPTDGNYALSPKYHSQPNNKSFDNAQNKVVDLPIMRNGHEVMVCEPRAYNDAAQIIKHLKERKTVLLNLHLLDKEQSVRIVDFLCGAAHALCGNQQKIGDSVFIFTPNNVNLASDSIQKTKTTISDAIWNQSL